MRKIRKEIDIGGWKLVIVYRENPEMERLYQRLDYAYNRVLFARQQLEPYRMVENKIVAWRDIPDSSLAKTRSEVIKALEALLDVANELHLKLGESREEGDS